MGRIHSKSTPTVVRNYKRKFSLKSIYSLSSANTIEYSGDTKMYGKNEAQRNDECDRLHINHFSIGSLWKSNFSAPVEDLLTCGHAKVLDVGCGAGTWILDTSLHYPKSEFYGIDILPLYPQCIKPHNVAFSQCDILRRLPYDDNVFDYIHMRCMSSSLTNSGWEYAIKELVRVLKPGGYIEICEFNHKWANEGLNSGRLRSQVVKELIKLYDVNLMACPTIKKLLKENDQLTDFHQRKKTVPFGSWGGKLGEVFLENAYWAVKNLKNAVHSLGMSDESYFAMIDSALIEIQSKENVFDTIYRFWAKKL